MLQFLVSSLKITLINAYGVKGVINEVVLVQEQWGTASILSNSTNLLVGVPTIDSIGNAGFDNVFVAYPEYGFYTLSQNRSDLVLSNDQSISILNPSTSDYKTLMTPDNMRSFYELYDK